jgi:cytosine/adenosine deaminase-related metal-dependent hydrolase
MVVDSGRIAWIGTALPERFASLPQLALPGCALLPGWINAHCHLEFSDLRAPVPASGDFSQWLAEVLAARRRDAEESDEVRRASRQESYCRGLRESWRAGVRWIVDNVTEPWDPEWIAAAARECRSMIPSAARQALVPETPFCVQPCFERLDVRASRGEATQRFAYEQLDAPEFPGRAQGGMAPHAPYTASLAVSRDAAQWSSQRRGLVSMHLAETPEELQWLNQRSGSLGRWIEPYLDEAHVRRIGTVEEHLQALADGWRTLLVHGNFLSPENGRFLAEHADRMGVVYCPRTHAWFHHPLHPAGLLKELGVSVFLGTDSRASNPDLSVWEEVRWASVHVPSRSPREWAAAATIEPSVFLSPVGGVGRLERGNAALMTAIQLSSEIGPDEGKTASFATRALAAPELAGRELSATEEEALWRELIACGRSLPLELHSAWDEVGGL